MHRMLFFFLDWCQGMPSEGRSDAHIEHPDACLADLRDVCVFMDRAWDQVKRRQTGHRKRCRRLLWTVVKFMQKKPPFLIPQLPPITHRKNKDLKSVRKKLEWLLMKGSKKISHQRAEFSAWGQNILPQGPMLAVSFPRSNFRMQKFTMLTVSQNALLKPKSFHSFFIETDWGPTAILAIHQGVGTSVTKSSLYTQSPRLRPKKEMWRSKFSFL